MTKVLKAIAALMSPEVRDAMIEALELKAKATPNPWDDVAVNILKVIFYRGSGDE